MSEIRVSVIIPTYDRTGFLINTIKSLKKQDFSGYEVIIVDNACLDETKIYLEKEIEDIDTEKYSIKYIQEPNIGLHNARHRGAKESNGDILLYIDDDVIADGNLLNEIINPYSNSEVGCVGGRILPKWEVEPPDWIKQFPKWYLSILDDEEGPKEVQWIYGCNFSIRKDLLFELGGFNPDAFGDKKMWWYRGDGEIGLLKKVHNAGKKVIYNPKAVVWHFIPKERLTVKYFKERAFKSGIEASYSKFRYSEKMSKVKLLVRSFAFGVLFFVDLFKSFAFRDLKAKVNSSYFKARCLYELKIVTDNVLRDFVKRENYWYEE